MKQDIENIIKKNLPEKRELKECGKCNACEMMMACEVLYADRQFNQALSQINPSKIADEVLKVVVETLRNNIDKIQKYTGGSSVEPKDIRVKLKDVLQLLSNLSLNKENKNNEGRNN